MWSYSLIIVTEIFYRENIKRNIVTNNSLFYVLAPVIQLYFFNFGNRLSFLLPPLNPSFGVAADLGALAK
jgi:hypothetical protein